jgi:hypothetical protein
MNMLSSLNKERKYTSTDTNMVGLICNHIRASLAVTEKMRTVELAFFSSSERGTDQNLIL